MKVGGMLKEYKALLDMSLLGIPVKGIATLYYEELTDKQRLAMARLQEHPEDHTLQLHVKVKGETLYNGERMSVLGIEV